MKVPKLRFGGFEDGWQSSEIYKIATISSGGTPDRAKSHYWNGSIPWVTTSLIDFNVIDNSIEFITQDGLKNSSAKLFPKDTLLIAMYGQGKTRGKVAILGLEASTNQACAAITFHSSTVNVQFAFQNLIGRYDEIRNLSNSGGQENLNASLIKQIQITFPGLFEQTKITNFLTTIDEKITWLTQKCDLLAQYKKGVMQQIFSQKLRFKDDDGREFPEWKKKGLGDVAEIIMGQSPDSNSYNNLQKGKPLIQGNADITNRKTSPRVWTTSSVKECKINDIILTVRAPVGAVAISYHNACIGRGVCAIRTNKETILSYIYQLLLWFEPTKWINLEQGSTFTAVSSKDIKTIVIALPSLPEQTKIANFLTAIDDKITQAQTQLEAVKRYKKGLLQQLFV